MSTHGRGIFLLIVLILFVFPSSVFAESQTNVPILCYHNFNPTVPGSMNMTPAHFEAQLVWLKENGFSIIPLTEAVEYFQGKRDSLPPKSVVITMDDGWQSVYTYIFPIAKKYQIPITLFIYPGNISVEKHAMTWDELRELHQSGLFDIQSHTFTHPNFKHARRGNPAKYQEYVNSELIKSKSMLEDKLSLHITLLAWPFGIYDSFLEQAAANAGYTMAFSIDALPANKSFRPMAEPRYMILQNQSMKTFTTIVNGAR